MKEKQKILIEFGEKVKFFREKLNICQEELAFRAGMHRTYVGMIERAEKNITLINIQKIATALNIKTNDLFNE